MLLGVRSLRETLSGFQLTEQASDDVGFGILAGSRATPLESRFMEMRSNQPMVPTPNSWKSVAALRMSGL